MKINKKTIISFLILSIIFIPMFVFAQNNGSVAHEQMINKLKNVGNKGGYELEVTTPQIIGHIISAFLDFLGIIFIVLTIIAGYRWMTASGNEEEVKKAQTTLKEAIIGLIISISVWTLWNFIFENLIIK